MLSVAIVDDDGKDASALAACVAKFCLDNRIPHKVERYESGGRFVLDYKAQYDVVFLDIEMDGLDGMGVAHSVRAMDARTVIVFVTNMAQCAVMGYKVDALDFVVKPVEYASFELVMRKVMATLRGCERRQVVLNVDGELQVVPCADIDYVEVVNHYLIYHVGERELRVRGSLADAEERLGAERFFRCSRYYLVNLQKITSVGKRVVRMGEREFSVGRGKWSELLARVNQLYGGVL